MHKPVYISVRRLIDAPFKVLAEDLDSAEPTGYDLDLMRSLAGQGLITPIVVQPLVGGRFRVLDGRKRLAAILMLVRADTPIYDVLRCIMRPASRIFAILRCRTETATEALQRDGDGDSRISPPSA